MYRRVWIIRTCKIAGLFGASHRCVLGGVLCRECCAGCCCWSCCPWCEGQSVARVLRKVQHEKICKGCCVKVQGKGFTLFCPVGRQKCFCGMQLSYVLFHYSKRRVFGAQPEALLLPNVFVQSICSLGWHEEMREPLCFAHRAGMNMYFVASICLL